MFENQSTKRSGRDCVVFVLGASIILTALISIGCRNGERTVHHVSGTVTFDGQPVSAGFVVFDPDVSAGNDGTQGFANITEGQFDTARGGRGVTGGAYVAQLRGASTSSRDGKLLSWQFEQALELPTADSRHDIVVPASVKTKARQVPDPP